MNKGMVYCGQCRSEVITCAHERRFRTDEEIQRDVEKAIAHEQRIVDAMTTEAMIRDIHQWLSEIMPAARAAVKMMDARTSLMRRWRGGVSKED